MSYPSVPQRFGGLVYSCVRIFFEYPSFTTEFRGGRRASYHLTPEGRRRLCPPPVVLGNLHRHGPSASSPVGLVLGIFGSHSTAGSTDPPPY
ncbi:hypothetical protein PENSUB_5300, partial [Penicillium subrubescens]